VRIDGLGGPVPVHVPDFVEDLRTSPHDVGCRREKTKQLELFGSEFDLDTFHGDPMGSMVDHERPSNEWRIIRFRTRVPAARNSADARDEFAKTERLRHVIVGAQFEPEHPIELVGARGEHDDRRRHAAAEFATHVATVHVGQSEIEKHYIARRRLERLPAGVSTDDLETLFDEPVLETVADGVIVLHHQNPHIHLPTHCDRPRRLPTGSPVSSPLESYSKNFDEPWISPHPFFGALIRTFDLVGGHRSQPKGHEVQKRAITVLSLVGVLTAGSAAAMVNTRVLSKDTAPAKAESVLMVTGTQQAQLSSGDQSPTTLPIPSNSASPTGGSSIGVKPYTVATAAPITLDSKPASSTSSAVRRLSAFQIGDAALIRVDSGASDFRIAEVVPSNGWTVVSVTPGATSGTAQVVLSSGSVEVTFIAELVGGNVVTRVETHAVGSSGSSHGGGGGGGAPSSSSSGGSGSGSGYVDDDGDDDSGEYEDGDESESDDDDHSDEGEDHDDDHGGDEDDD